MLIQECVTPPASTHAALEKRQAQWKLIGSSVFDAVIVGGGINGACLYHSLCSQGYRVLLVEQRDFAAGTSQASAMWIWGGLLYLSRLDLASVFRFSRAREQMLQDMRNWVRPQQFRYLSCRRGGRLPLFVQGALYFYWLLGSLKRQRPRRLDDYPESAFLKNDVFRACLEYEEATVSPSDSRFVLQWILGHHGRRGVAINYCEVHEGAYRPSSGRWALEVTDSLLETRERVQAKWVINAAGVWTDALNRRFGICSPYRHFLSKGVFIAIQRPSGHECPLVVDTGEDATCFSLIPWGPVALWGPTEATVQTPEEGFSIQPDDIEFLLSHLNRYIRPRVEPRDIVSLRCGVRPLVMRRSDSPPSNPLLLSRRHVVYSDSNLPWISVYGGKITSCIPLANAVASLLHERLNPSQNEWHPDVASFSPDLSAPKMNHYPGLEAPLPSAQWCAENELCWTLEDYLRRRTNIAQWMPRGGLGRNDENFEHLVRVAGNFCREGPAQAEAAVRGYREKIREQFDLLLTGRTGTVSTEKNP